MNGFYKFAMTVMRLIMPLWYRIEAEGLENIPEEGGYLFVSNHRSNADPILISVQNPHTQFCFLAKQELFSGALTGWLLRKLGAIAVDRGAGDVTALEEIEFRLQNGQNALIFPEGTRSKDGKLGHFKTGAALIAANTGVPVVPVAISFDDELHFRSRIYVRYGEPFRIPQTDASEPSAAVLKQVRQEMTKNVSALLEMNTQTASGANTEKAANSTESTEKAAKTVKNKDSEVTKNTMSKNNHHNHKKSGKPTPEKEPLKKLAEEAVEDIAEETEEKAEEIEETAADAAEEIADAVLEDDASDADDYDDSEDFDDEEDFADDEDDEAEDDADSEEDEDEAEPVDEDDFVDEEDDFTDEANEDDDFDTDEDDYDEDDDDDDDDFDDDDDEDDAPAILPFKFSNPFKKLLKKDTVEDDDFDDDDEDEEEDEDDSDFDDDLNEEEAEEEKSYEEDIDDEEDEDDAPAKPSLFSGFSLKKAFKKKETDDFDEEFEDEFENADSDAEDDFDEDEEYDDDDEGGKHIDYGRIALILTFVILGIFAVDFFRRLWNDWKSDQGTLDLQSQASSVESMADDPSASTLPIVTTAPTESENASTVLTTVNILIETTTTTTSEVVDNRTTQTVAVPTESLHNGSLILIDGAHQQVNTPALVTLGDSGVGASVNVVNQAYHIDGNMQADLNRWMADFNAATGLGKQILIYGAAEVGPTAPYSTPLAERTAGLSLDLAIMNPPGSALLFSPYTPDGNYAWLTEHAADYGFIVRFPAGKDEKTGMDGLAWHFRYVGAPHAKYMYEHEMCLEEYLLELQDHPWNSEHLTATVDGVEYEMYYVPADDESANTEIKYPVAENGGTPMISGDNNEGFVVACVKS